jgi:hypothetical protein
MATRKAGGTDRQKLIDAARKVKAAHSGFHPTQEPVERNVEFWGRASLAHIGERVSKRNLNNLREN